MTVTNNYGLQLPIVGGDTGVWGTELNNNMITPVDTALGGNQAVTITSADVTLSNTQFQNAVFTVSGALTGNRNLFIPVSQNSSTTACGGKFVVVNNTSGLFTLTVKSTLGASTGVTVAQGGEAHLYSDGLNVKYADVGIPSYVQSVSNTPNGQIAGVAGSVNTNAQLAYDYTNNNLYACTTTGSSTTAVWSQPSVTVTRGFDTAINLQLNASVATNNLTINAVAANTGSAATSQNPITIYFRDGTLANGDPVAVNITSALSITAPNGASLGATNGIPFRFWVVLYNDSGTPVLGLINCSNGNTIFPLNEALRVTPTAIGAGSTTAGIFYSSGVVAANAAFRILGFVEYASGLVTAGTFNNPPTIVQLFGPGIKKPGDIIQCGFFTTTTTTTGSGATKTATALTVSPVLSSAVNLIQIDWSGNLNSSGGTSTYAQIGRGSSSVLIGSVAAGNNNANIASLTVAGFALDQPAITSPTYTLYIWAAPGSNPVLNPAATGATLNAVVFWQEIMG